MRKVVVNPTPLIALSHVGQLDILKKLYGKIIIPEAVYRAVYKNRIYLQEGGRQFA